MITVCTIYDHIMRQEGGKTDDTQDVDGNDVK